MTKAELINVVAQKTGAFPKRQRKAVSAVVDAITEALASGDKVSLVGFGTFEVKERGEKKASIPAPRGDHHCRL